MTNHAKTDRLALEVDEAVLSNVNQLPLGVETKTTVSIDVSKLRGTENWDMDKKLRLEENGVVAVKGKIIEFPIGTTFRSFQYKSLEFVGGIEAIYRSNTIVAFYIGTKDDIYTLGA